MGLRCGRLVLLAWVVACGSRGGGGTESAEAEAVPGVAAAEGERSGGAAPDDGTAPQGTPAGSGATAGGDDAAEAGSGVAPDAPPCLPVPVPPATSTTNVNWDHDDSTACPPEAFPIAIDLPEYRVGELDVCAVVEAIRPAANPAGGGREMYGTVVLAGDGAEVDRSFVVSTAPDVPLPFAVGDRVAVRVRVESVGIHRVAHVTIADASGRLLLAFSGAGDASWAPGWRVNVLEVGSTEASSQPGGAERREHVVGLSTDGRVARVPSHGCRRLGVTRGDFLVWAHSISYGPGSRLPDSAAYTQYALVRAPAR